MKRHQLEAKTSSFVMAYTHAKDRQEGLEEQNMAVAGLPTCLMPGFIPFVDPATGWSSGKHNRQILRETQC
jgi:hypothetical protein